MKWFISVILFASLVECASAYFRYWSDYKGRLKYAELVTCTGKNDDDEITIMEQSGVKKTVKIKSLSQRDKEYIYANFDSLESWQTATHVDKVFSDALPPVPRMNEITASEDDLLLFDLPPVPRLNRPESVPSDIGPPQLDLEILKRIAGALIVLACIWVAYLVVCGSYILAKSTMKQYPVIAKAGVVCMSFALGIGCIITIAAWGLRLLDVPNRIIENIFTGVLFVVAPCVCLYALGIGVVAFNDALGDWHSDKSRSLGGFISSAFLFGAVAAAIYFATTKWIN